MEDRFILIIQSSCPYCDKTIDLLSAKDLRYNVIEFTPDQKEVLNKMKTAYEWDTVPMIFHRNQNTINFIGGFTELVKYFEQEEKSR